MPKSDDEDLAVQKLSNEIVSYLSAHPHAADNCEGITKWWIRRQRLEESVLCVQQALNLLIEKGTLEELHDHSGNVVYRVHRKVLM